MACVIHAVRDIAVVCFITAREKLFVRQYLLPEVCCTATCPISQETDICLPGFAAGSLLRGNVASFEEHKHIVGYELLWQDYCMTKFPSFNYGEQFWARICCRRPTAWPNCLLQGNRNKFLLGWDLPAEACCVAKFPTFAYKSIALFTNSLMSL